MGRLSYEALLPAFAASTIADITTKAWQMGHTHYHIPFILELSAMNFLYAVSAGSFFCICSVVFSGLIHNISNLLKEKISFLP
ncbi:MULTISPECIES: chloride channel protein [Dyadobacter]|uniref:chloride channel protein n=1 Tax=Dyadobacter TaxID=120831 RepID=UPI001C70D5E0|nr:chloride channel protein [Dyadobacter psychrotolerans]